MTRTRVLWIAYISAVLLLTLVVGILEEVHNADPYPGGFSHYVSNLMGNDVGGKFLIGDYTDPGTRANICYVAAIDCKNYTDWGFGLEAIKKYSSDSRWANCIQREDVNVQPPNGYIWWTCSTSEAKNLFDAYATYVEGLK